MIFERMYAAVAVCAPARTAVLVGRRPDTTRNWKLGGGSEYWRKFLPKAVSLPQYFRQSGFVTYGVGKIFHPGPVSGDNDAAFSWSPESLPYYDGAGEDTCSAPNPEGGEFGWCIMDTEPDTLQDGRIAQRAVSILNTLRQQRKPRPFFLAVGFHRPHMPEYCPREFYNQYPRDEVDLAVNPKAPQRAPQIAVQPSAQFRRWMGLPSFEGPCQQNFTLWLSEECRVPDEVARDQRRAYRACTSYADAMIGRVVEALKVNGFYNSTVVVLLGDHGWHLGDLGQWAKYTNYEAATRIPFIVKLAGQTRGFRTSAFVEANDVFPTVAEAAGLPIPPLCDPGSQARLCAEGVSVLPLWQDPRRPWKTAAFSQYPRPAEGFAEAPEGLPPFPWASGGEAVMGYAIREDEWRYVEWVKFDHAKAVPDWSVVYGRELYNHSASPVPDATFDYENENVATAVGQEERLRGLSQRLRVGWRAALPPGAAAVHNVVVQELSTEPGLLGWLGTRGDDARAALAALQGLVKYSRELYDAALKAL